jgi:mono/diheme cytochrome c family protein
MTLLPKSHWLNALALTISAAPFCAPLTAQEAPRVSFAEVRAVLASSCLTCHGPDANKRKGGPKNGDGLRLDTDAGLQTTLDGGRHPVVPGSPNQSELLRRISATGKDRMPPPGKGAKLSDSDIDLVRRWISQGADWEPHWSNVKPSQSQPPITGRRQRNAIDPFVVKRLNQEGLQPSPAADRASLLRRLSLDLTGLPPSPKQLDRFRSDTKAGAYLRAVDRLLASDRFGERWTAPWLDLARYADSAGYADDPPRTIWGWRDWVIRALNANMPFDQFTIEQLAGDLLPNPSVAQLVATGFHRNTMTNSEGGTIDEEFRSAAIVDRVNTTMSVWMGSTTGCAQCHTHKYDPLTHEEYFQLYAFFNGTADADRRNESPVQGVYGDDQKALQKKWQNQIASIEAGLDLSNPPLQRQLQAWDRNFPRRAGWTPATADPKTTSDARIAVRLSTGSTALRFSIPKEQRPTALKLAAAKVPAKGSRVARGQYVRIALPGKAKNLHLAEVQVWQGSKNLAQQGKAKQSSTGFNGPAHLANDGNTDGHYANAKSTSHTATSDNPWWEVNLGKNSEIDRIVIWNRTDAASATQRLQNFTVSLLDHSRQTVWHKNVVPAPTPSAAFTPRVMKPVEISSAYQTAEGQWIAILSQPVSLPATERLELRLHNQAGKALKPAAVESTDDPRFSNYGQASTQVLRALANNSAPDNEARRTTIAQGFLKFAPKPRAAAAQRDALKSKIAKLKPVTTVPIMQELAKPRATNVLIRGSYNNLGKPVRRGVPKAFPPMNPKAPVNRLGLARWLTSADNPRTARVAVNRYWEQLFGTGLVTTAGDFGVQGEPPSHPGLLDWLAVEFMNSGWDVKALLRTIVNSATYRQSSDADPGLVSQDPRNQLLARGPRFRLSAEMIRDSALFVSGLLSDKMYGPSVRPPRPKLGLRAAFGGSTDWTTSAGQDRYRRGLYTSWRRTIPYPSMATFDAPSREVCTIARIRTNTPLQALVTLNDPVYIEAAQALARRILKDGGAKVQSQVRHGFRLCLLRDPSQRELDRLINLQQQAQERFATAPKEARIFATDPLGPPPPGIAIESLAAWTLVANVLLNLDEFLVKR